MEKFKSYPNPDQFTWPKKNWARSVQQCSALRNSNLKFFLGIDIEIAAFKLCDKDGDTGLTWSEVENCEVVFENIENHSKYICTIVQKECTSDFI